MEWSLINAQHQILCGVFESISGTIKWSHNSNSKCNNQKGNRVQNRLRLMFVRIIFLKNYISKR
jgi:hypothetical protein